MLGDALAFPRQSDEWVKTVLIGGVLTVLSVLVLPAFLVYGYQVRVLRAAGTGAETAPVFDEWGDLFVDGLRMVGVVLAYTVLPAALTVVLAAVLGAFTMGLSGEGAAGSVTAAGASGVVGVGVGLLAVGLLVVPLYLLPAALTNMAREQSVAAAFDVGVVSAVATTTDYLLAVFLAVVVSVVLGTIASVLTLLLVGVFAAFYVQVSVLYLFGRGVHEALDEGEAAGARDGGAAVE